MAAGGRDIETESGSRRTVVEPYGTSVVNSNGGIILMADQNDTAVLYHENQISAQVRIFDPLLTGYPVNSNNMFQPYAVQDV